MRSVKESLLRAYSDGLIPTGGGESAAVVGKADLADLAGVSFQFGVELTAKGVPHACVGVRVGCEHESTAQGESEVKDRKSVV